MKEVLLTLDYRDNTNKFWFESYCKNKIVAYDPEKESIHEVIKNVCKDEGMILTYGGKPNGNVYRDKKDGTSFIVGYMYRGKSEIHDRDMPKPQTGYFDVWATIHEVDDFQFEEIES